MVPKAGTLLMKPLSLPHGREALTGTVANNFSTEMRLNLKTPPHNDLSIEIYEI